MLRVLSALLAAFILVVGGLGAVALAQASGGSGSISGRVTFVGGKPAPQKLVQYQPLGGKNAGNTTVTDPDGNYSFKNLSDGIYLVGFFHPDRVPADEPANRGIIPDPNASAETITRTGAAPVVKQVEIKGGAHVTGIDFTITDIGPETVEGPEVTGAGLEPVTLPPTGAREGGDNRSMRAPLLVAIIALIDIAAAAAYIRVRTN